MSKAKYLAWQGLEFREIEADSVVLKVDDKEYELHYRKSDGEISLYSNRGTLIIEPVAANVVRISSKR